MESREEGRFRPAPPSEGAPCFPLLARRPFRHIGDVLRPAARCAAAPISCPRPAGVRASPSRYWKRGCTRPRSFASTVDRAGRYGVSASNDKTARVWDLGQRAPAADAAGAGGRRTTKASSTRWRSARTGRRVAVGGFTGPKGSLRQFRLLFRAGRRATRRAHRRAAQRRESPGLVAGRAAAGHRPWGRTASASTPPAPPTHEIARDTGYGGDSYSVDFDRSGRLVSTSYDGKLRLYDARSAPRSCRPRGQRRHASLFRPLLAGRPPHRGRLLDSTAVSVVSGTDLSPLQSMDTGAAVKRRSQQGDLVRRRAPPLRGGTQQTCRRSASRPRLRSRQTAASLPPGRCRRTPSWICSPSPTGACSLRRPTRRGASSAATAAS